MLFRSRNREREREQTCGSHSGNLLIFSFYFLNILSLIASFLRSPSPISLYIVFVLPISSLRHLYFLHSTFLPQPNPPLFLSHLYFHIFYLHHFSSAIFFNDTPLIFFPSTPPPFLLQPFHPDFSFPFETISCRPIIFFSATFLIFLFCFCYFLP